MEGKHISIVVNVRDNPHLLELKIINHDARGMCGTYHIFGSIAVVELSRMLSSAIESGRYVTGAMEKPGVHFDRDRG